MVGTIVREHRYTCTAFTQTQHSKSLNVGALEKIDPIRRVTCTDKCPTLIPIAFAQYVLELSRRLLNLARQRRSRSIARAPAAPRCECSQAAAWEIPT